MWEINVIFSYCKHIFVLFYFIFLLNGICGVGPQPAFLSAPNEVTFAWEPSEAVRYHKSFSADALTLVQSGRQSEVSIYQVLHNSSQSICHFHPFSHVSILKTPKWKSSFLNWDRVVSHRCLSLIPSIKLLFLFIVFILWVVFLDLHFLNSLITMTLFSCMQWFPPGTPAH